MTAKFKLSQTADNIMVILLFAAIVSPLVLYFTFEAVILILIAVAVWIAIILGVYYAFGGELIADEKGVTVVTTFWDKKIKEKFIEYSDIDYTDCGVSTYSARGWGISYSMYFTIKKKSGSKYTVSNKLNISSSLPTNEPDKYKRYIHNQPLMQLSNYIDSKLHLNTSA